MKILRHSTYTAFLCIALDIILAASLIYTTYYVVYEMPDITVADNIGEPLSHTQGVVTCGTQTAADASADTDFSRRFSGQFSKTTKITKNSYVSRDVSVQVDKHTLGSGNDKITYFTADIYLASMDSFKTAFADDTYGTGHHEHIKDMSKRLESILALNGDSYCFNQKHLSGLLVRNGEIYRSEDTAADMCVLYRNGELKTYEAGEFNSADAVKNGALHTWVFGPALLTKDGKAKKDFNTWGYIKKRHPRTAIGCYEPGHYCFLVCDGRQEGYSKGMTLEELSKLFEDMGCRTAYNLDGGHTTFMTLKNKVVNHSYKPDKEITDCIYLCEPKGGQK